MRDCDKFGIEEDSIGIGVGEPCPNEGMVSVFLHYVLCRDCFKAYRKYRRLNAAETEGE